MSINCTMSRSGIGDSEVPFCRETCPDDRVLSILGRFVALRSGDNPSDFAGPAWSNAVEYGDVVKMDGRTIGLFSGASRSAVSGKKVRATELPYRAIWFSLPNPTPLTGWKDELSYGRLTGTVRDGVCSG